MFLMILEVKFKKEGELHKVVNMLGLVSARDSSAKSEDSNLIL